MNDELMGVVGVLPDAFDAQLEVGQVVPTGNEDGENGMVDCLACREQLPANGCIHVLYLYGAVWLGRLAMWPVILQRDGRQDR